MKDLDVIEFKQKIDNNDEFILIDVREPFEYEMFNLKGKLMPLGNLMSYLNELEPFKEKEIIIHCRSGARSATAKDILTQMGYKNVRNLLGGVLAWQEKFINP